jgi:hypothetical protein
MKIVKCFDYSIEKDEAPLRGEVAGKMTADVRVNDSKADKYPTSPPRRTRGQQN